MSERTKLLTNLLFEPKGKHDPALTYRIKDTVMSPDGSQVYFALKDVPAGIALDNEEYWMLQIDMADIKKEMADAVARFGDYAKIVGTRVKGETAKASSNPATFLPDAGSLLMPVTVLEPQQEGSGDPSPDNIRPFIGYDVLGLTRAGKNLYNKAAYPFAQYRENIPSASRTPPIFIKAGTYTFKGANGFGNNFIKIYSTYEDAANDTSKYVEYIFATNQIITFDKDVFVRLQTNDLPKPYDYDAVSEQWQIELGSTATPFAPYQGKTYTVQIGQTVYGGRFDWLTGKLTVEYAMKQIKLDGVWDIDLGLEGFTRANQPGAVDYQGAYTYGSTDGAFSHGKYLQSWGDRSIHVYVNSCAFVMVLPTTLIGTTSESVNAWLAAQYAAGTPVQIAYKLAEPIEIQLPPTIISAADPEQTNTLYGDGSIEVEYVKPLHVSIEERVAAALAAMTE